jgi:hypothetical protein
LVLAQGDVARSIARWNLSPRMQGFKKCDQSGSFGRSQIFSVRWHVSAALDYLSNQLILGKPHGDAVKRRPSLAAQVSKRMAVATLLDLKDERSLPFQCCRAMQKLVWDRGAAPCIHVRAPRCVSSEMRKCAQGYCDQQDGQNRDGPPAPALLSFARKKGQKEQTDYR